MTKKPAVRFAVPVVLFRGLAAVLVVLYFVLAAVILGLRYLVLPNIDDYRDRIETRISAAVGAPVSIGRIEADWYRLNPQLTLLETSIRSEHGGAALELPRVAARLSWATLLTGRPELLQLSIERPYLSLRRDARGMVHVADFPLLAFTTPQPRGKPDRDENDEGKRQAWAEADHPVARWLLAQPDIRIMDARLDWRDETGELPAFHIPDVDLQLQSRRLGTSRFVVAVPDTFQGGRQWLMQAEWQRSLLEQGEHGLEWGNWHGRVFVSAEEVDLPRLRPWLGDFVPDELAGVAAGRAWFDFHHGRWRGWLADIAVRNARGRIEADGEALAFSAAGVRLARDEDGGVRAGGFLRDALFYLPGVFEAPVAPVQELRGTVAHDAGSRWQWSDVFVRAGEAGQQATLTGSGSWQPQAGLRWGAIDLMGRIEQADAGAVARWMPLAVDADVREWLRLGLRAGEIAGAEVRLAGDLQGFPYAGSERERGEFRIEGDVHGVAIDLEPDVEPGWPLITGLRARLTIDRDHLGADIAGGEIRVGQNSAIQIGATRLDISDMEDEAKVDVVAATQGDAESYLAYLRQSPLADQTAGSLGAARIDGSLEVPLRVRVRLNDGDTSVEGRVRAEGNTVLLPGWAAPVTGMRGEVRFTESRVEFSGLRGRWLGGELRVSGRSGADGAAEAEFQGQLSIAALRELWPSPAWERLRGQLPYRGSWRMRRDGGESLAVSSDLAGLALDFPAPLHKTASQTWPVRAQWERTHGASGGQWRITAADRWQLLAAWPQDAEPGSLPPRLAFGMPAPLDLPAQGWHLRFATEAVNLDDWREVLAGFAQPASTSKPSTSARRAVAGQAPRRAVGLAALPWTGLPLPLKIDVQAQRLTALDQLWAPMQLAFEITRNDVLRLRFDADAVSGWIGWRPSSAAGPARLEMNFDRLLLPRREQPAGSAGLQPATAPAAAGPHDAVEPWADPARWPFVDVNVADLRWGDIALGELRFSASPGQMASAGWQIDSLSLVNPDIALRGQGSWRTQANRPRTALDFNGTIHDAGGLLARLGLADVVAGGEGEVEASVAWPGMPWAFAVPMLEADLELSLDDGRFLPVSSAAGRLLATLSLQALARAATFQGNALFESGFAWDTLRASARVAEGNLELRGFDMRGPSAAALLSGRADLLNETQDLKALILPRIDASAAALLAGIAINPIVGLGAFLGQWLLREPLAQVLSLEYGITGSWADPQITRLSPVSAAADAGSEPVVP
ncbi:MAG: AsmA family protein [Pigmentiphaga sp.]|nr:AsmA family protein [Pigmentiphaga sp.]